MVHAVVERHTNEQLTSRRSLMKARFAFTLLWALSIAASSTAQTTTSILEGRVKDSSGAILTDASVAVEGATVSRTVTTDATGQYRALALPAGNYRVTASMAGFQTKVVRGVTLVLDRTVDLDITLAPAPVSESVSVTGATPLIDPTTASTRQVIDDKTIETMPLNGRNYLDL